MSDLIPLTQTSNWNSAILWFAITIIGLKIFERYIVTTLRKWAEKTKTEFDDIIIDILQSTGWPLYITAGAYVGSRFLSLTPGYEKIITSGTLVVTFFYIIQGLQKLADYLIDTTLAKSKNKGFDDPMIKRVFGWTARGAIYGTAVILILQNLGFQITALLGGLGIGGLAIAFALQNILGDIFSYFTIYFDKPFEIGDFIIVGNDMGTIEKIGLKSTRLRALSGEQLIISNQELTNARINNFKRLKQRRAVFTVGITYETPASKVKKIPEYIKAILEKQKEVEIDRVHFKAFGDSSLDFETVYFFNSDDYIKYMDTQQNINIAILEKFIAEKIDLAYPTRTVYINR